MFRFARAGIWLWFLAVSPALGAEEVDLQLVLAADRSGSIPPDQRREQRLGFVAAIRNAALQRAMLAGPSGRVAVVYFEWSGASDQEIIVPWTILASTNDMSAFADALEAQAIEPRGGDTSISGALSFAEMLLASCPCSAWRSVVDISGNGSNNDGPPVAPALDRLLASGATVNALILPQPLDRRGPYDNLFTATDVPARHYYESEVIGGPGAFAISIDLDDGFGLAILRKLVLEVAFADVMGNGT